MENKNVIVTGGLGFIGSHIVEELMKNNKVTIIDNLSTGKMENLNNPNHPNLNIIKGDLNDLDLKSILEGKDYKYVLTPKASYNVSALIKGKKKYDWDWGAQISPYDLLLVWGDLANTNINSGIQYSQSGRWYHSRFSYFPYGYV